MEHYLDAIRDRRSTDRFLANAPVFVYGYGATDDPFHERTEALSVNAGGGLITLTTSVNSGQTLLLINEVNLKEEKCTVIRQVPTVARSFHAVQMQCGVPRDESRALPR